MAGAQAPYYTNSKTDGVDYMEASDLEAIEDGFVDVDEDKANKVTPGTTGDLAALGADGDLTDSGKTPPSGEIVGTTDTQTLTNKTIDGDDNTVQDLPYTAIKSTSRSGSDATLITGTAGTANDLAIWNADGDLVDGPTPPSGTIVGTSDTQTLTNKTLTSPTVNSPTVSAPTITGAVTEETGAMSGVALEPDNGSIQTKTLSSAPTFTDGLADGQYLTIHVEGLSTYSPTWPVGIVWVTGAGDTEPTWTAKDVIHLWKVGSTLYAAKVGSYA